jgi:hypothetical protein
MWNVRDVLLRILIDFINQIQLGLEFPDKQQLLET